MKYPIRVVPWWTEGANRFVTNLSKWYPTALGRRLSAFEIGSGNSTLYLLAKNFRVTSVECDEGYIKHIAEVANSTGYSVNVVSKYAEIDEKFDLNIIKLAAYSNAAKPGKWYKSLGIENVDLDYDLLINDGVDRLLFMEKFIKCTKSIVLLDNCEYAANWGRLTKSSAKPDLIKVLRMFLRSNEWRQVLFEQPEGRNGMGTPDATGWESNHRWVTAISWGRAHLLSQLMVSDIGLPLVNLSGRDDADTESLQDRCGYDWDNMKWEIEADFPDSLDLGLFRGSQ